MRGWNVNKCKWAYLRLQFQIPFCNLQVIKSGSFFTICTISFPLKGSVLFLFRLIVKSAISFPLVCYFFSAYIEKELLLFRSVLFLFRLIISTNWYTICCAFVLMIITIFDFIKRLSRRRFFNFFVLNPNFGDWYLGKHKDPMKFRLFGNVFVEDKLLWQQWVIIW